MTYRRYRIPDGVDAEAEARAMGHRSPVSARVLIAIHRGHSTSEAIIAGAKVSRSSMDSCVHRLMAAGLVEYAPVEGLWDDIPDLMIDETKGRGRGVRSKD